jgi:hypothetical protein
MRLSKDQVWEELSIEEGNTVTNAEMNAQRINAGFGIPTPPQDQPVKHTQPQRVNISPEVYAFARSVGAPVLLVERLFAAERKIAELEAKLSRGYEPKGVEKR